MAGDWIKVEVVTPDKPEVFVMAEMLNIDPDAVVGKLVRVWIWADAQSRDGHAGSVTGALINRIASAPGFADAMLKAGWLERTKDGFRFPNFDRHNGKSAKTRGLSKIRKSRQRHADVTQESRDERDSSVTREEKRREELKDVSDDTSGEEVDSTAASATASNVVIAEWNMLGLPFKRAMTTKKRRTALRSRLADPWWLEHWRDGLERVRGSPFCRGEGDSGWIADVDWFLRPDTLVKIIEGKYDPRPNGNRHKSTAHAREAANADAFATLHAAAAAIRREESG